MEITYKQSARLYEIVKRFAAGLVLTGSEVKSCKMGRVNFNGAYCDFSDDCARLRLKNFYIAPYSPAAREQKAYNPYRERVVLLTKPEMRFLSGKLTEQGITIVPLRLYTDRRLVKCEIGVCRGLKKYDKREKMRREEFVRRKRRMVAR